MTYEDEIPKRDPRRRAKKRKYGYRVKVAHWREDREPYWWCNWYGSESARKQGMEAAKRGRGILGWIDSSHRSGVDWDTLELIER